MSNDTFNFPGMDADGRYRGKLPSKWAKAYCKETRQAVDDSLSLRAGRWLTDSELVDARVRHGYNVTAMDTLAQLLNAALAA